MHWPNCARSSLQRLKRQRLKRQRLIKVNLRTRQDYCGAGIAERSAKACSLLPSVTTHRASLALAVEKSCEECPLWGAKILVTIMRRVGTSPYVLGRW